ncbi:uncharacterized protein UDID_18341 [Ustilago sp. UG-2017a]|nr:uncharacterized protein UDID_18341 [Ustilago sp. UG-2017a]
MTRISRMIGLDMPLWGGVEDAPASPVRDTVKGNTQDWGIGKVLGDEEDKQNAKLVGANTAYARGLTPWYARDTWHMDMTRQSKYRRVPRACIYTPSHVATIQQRYKPFICDYLIVRVPASGLCIGVSKFNCDRRFAGGRKQIPQLKLVKEK